MNNLTFEEYIKKYHSEVVEEYERYLKREMLPKLGQRVKTLTSGFGLYGGFVVIAYTDKYIEIRDKLGDIYLVDKDFWFNQIKVIG